MRSKLWFPALLRYRLVDHKGDRTVGGRWKALKSELINLSRSPRISKGFCFAKGDACVAPIKPSLTVGPLFGTMGYVDDLRSRR